jgi:hypothetical protein
VSSFSRCEAAFLKTQTKPDPSGRPPPIRHPVQSRPDYLGIGGTLLGAPELASIYGRVRLSGVLCDPDGICPQWTAGTARSQSDHQWEGSRRHHARRRLFLNQQRNPQKLISCESLVNLSTRHCCGSGQNVLLQGESLAITSQSLNVNLRALRCSYAPSVLCKLF